MNTDYDNERIDLENEEYFDRSGCGPIVAVLAVIVMSLLVVGGLYLFTRKTPIL